jgi:hypothetical protein
MMGRRISILFIWLLVFYSNASDAQTFIAGQPVFCQDINGIPVKTVPAPQLNDVGKATIYGGFPVIFLNPNVLRGLPPAIQLFWYAHECGHHVLGHPLSQFQITAERNADCWAIRIGRDQGWFTQYDLVNMKQYFINNPGSLWGHLPGPQRLRNFANCFNS